MVLVTDDHRDSADALTAKLRLQGIDTQTAYSGAEALALAERMHPTVVLLDIAMPDMDGYEVARKIRQTRWGRRAKLIAVTGFDTPRDIRQSQAAGFDYHLVKPIDLETLLTLLVDPHP